MNQSNALQQVVSEHFSRAAAQYDTAAQLQLKVIKKLANQLLPEFKMMQANKNLHILDVGCGTANLLQFLPSPFAYTGVDIAEGMLAFSAEKFSYLAADNQLAWQLADAQNLPFEENQFDFVFSSLAWQWCDLEQVLAQSYRVLKPGGTLIFSTLLDGTLCELNQAFKQLDNQIHINQFIDSQALEQAINSQDWHQVNAQVLTEKTHYDSVYQLLKELKSIGANTVSKNNQLYKRQPLTKNRLARLELAYPRQSNPVQTIASWQVAYCQLRKS
ncbi:methyltransferase domain-containing protein [Catenovulum adriaticum]|uniref:Methyltransferase domain-containing protein n=1 Tax=Catenovulum adriaticum TaxID=2984846 RepID=A0ABY7ARU9_9ALTE|nr:methyltransferase domain-containing protein [Catenovulum sp. TS8]WAJ71401.1 methyltransferase domain-containing protein [Catenovulum sp. TS8]